MKYLFLLLPILTCFSCVNKNLNNIYENLYYISPHKCSNIEGLRYVYVVDTVEIKDALVVETFSGYKFVMSKFIYDQYYNGSDDFLIQSPDTYIYEDNFMPQCVYSSTKKNYLYNTCQIYDGFIQIDINKKKNIKNCFNDIREHKDYLILLIMGRYYNNNYTHVYNI